MSQPLKVTFTLSDRDLGHFRRIMKKAIVAAREKSEEEIVKGALTMIEQARGSEPPAYVIEHLDRLATIVRMTQDLGWSLPQAVKDKILAATSYFTDPDDLIPDSIPGLGFLDDAIMIELLAQELRRELDGYEAFCRLRDREEERPWHEQGRVTRDKKIEQARKKTRAKIRDLQRRDTERGAETGTRRFRLW